MRMKTALVMLILLLSLFAAVIGVLLWNARRSDMMRQEKLQADRPNAVRQVKAGEGLTNVYDGKLLDMLAADKACAERMTAFQFSMIDFRDAKAADVRSFRRLQSAGFYDVKNVDSFFKQREPMPELRSLWFESTQVPLDTVKSFRYFPNLAALKFEEELSEETLDEMRAALPGVDIRGYEDVRVGASSSK
jgi:hypothetical protein